MNVKKRVKNWWNYKPTPKEMHQDAYFTLIFAVVLLIFSLIGFCQQNIGFGILFFFWYIVSVISAIQSERQSKIALQEQTPQ